MSFSTDPTSASQNPTPNVGELGERLVAEWLQTQNWVILHHRWRCRWGEIDLIAQHEETGRGGDGEAQHGFLTPMHGCNSGKILSAHPRHRCRADGENLLPNLETNGQHHSSLTPSPQLAFVEVKTRSSGNWDADGRLAITPQKQAKLWQAAQLFLAKHPELANLACRFDVALVSCQRVSQPSRSVSKASPSEDGTNLSPSPAAKGKAEPISSIKLGQPIFTAGYRLILQDYIEAAFDQLL